MELPSGRESSIAYTFDILVDPVDGKVLKIRSRWPEGIPPMAPEPSAGAAEDRMTGCGLTRYHGFPQEDPALTFADALRAAPGLGARQIVALYVTQSMMDGPRIPVWSVTARGVPPPLRCAPPPVDDSYGGSPTVPSGLHWEERHTVHAATGRWMATYISS